MNNAKEALIWITNILQRYSIPFQIAGGLAVRAYGSTRELMDIDIDISENDFEKIINEVKPFIIFGPAQFKDDKWDLFLLTLNYMGQEIDLSGAYTTKIYNNNTHVWEKITTNLAKVNYINIEGLILPVIPRDELILYKKILARPVDLLDIIFLENN
ncbi:MAG: hypothetical protein ACD_46C00220G0003 [uncultured bacterium]|nr:MAG: hypothetical protein ACD_46C00220G0003 [uncultured bacterium]